VVALSSAIPPIILMSAMIFHSASFSIATKGKRTYEITDAGGRRGYCQRSYAGTVTRFRPAH
jgi:hypothetical protein